MMKIMRWDLMEIVGLCLACSHLLFLVLLVTWFSLNKPESWAQFKTRLHTALRGKRKPLTAQDLRRTRVL
jgi:hypothetical protein